MRMSVIMLALYGKSYLRLSKTHGTSSTARGEVACRQSFVPIANIHLPPAGIDAPVNHSVVSISGSIQLPVSRSRAEGLQASVGMLCPLCICCERFRPKTLRYCPHVNAVTILA